MNNLTQNLPEEGPGSNLPPPESTAILDNYLDEACAPLHRDLSAEQIDQIRAEMRSHLVDLAAAYRELGESEEQALDSAIGQFGSSRTLRRDWRRAMYRSGAGSLQRAVRVSLWVYTANATLTYLYLRFWPYQMYTEHFLYLLAFPIPAGILAGGLARGREMKGSLIAQSLLYVPWVSFLFYVLILPKAVYILRGHGQEPTLVNVASEVAHGRMLGIATLIILGFGLGWIATGTLAAGLGGWLRRVLARPACSVATN